VHLLDVVVLAMFERLSWGLPDQLVISGRGNERGSAMGARRLQSRRRSEALTARRPRHPGHRKPENHRPVFIAAVIVAVVVAIVFAWNLTHSAHRGVPTPATTSTPSVTPTVPVPVEPLHLGAAELTFGRYPVTTRSIVLRRGTRVLPTTIYVPDLPAGTGVPVIEFAHGYDIPPSAYRAMLSAWASAGYLVVAPTSPGMAPGKQLTDELSAIRLQTADLEVVRQRIPSLPVAVEPDMHEVVLAGHSDGATAVKQIAFAGSPGTADYAAYVLLSWGTSPSDLVNIAPNISPVFIADSRADEFQIWPYSLKLFAAAHDPKVLVGIGLHQNHLAPWSRTTPLHLSVWSAIVDFSTWSVTGSAAAHRWLKIDLARPGLIAQYGPPAN